MKIHTLLAVLVATMTLGVFASPDASAQEQGGTAVVRIQNDSEWALDCRVFWGNNDFKFDGLAAHTVSADRALPVDANNSRNAVCKKAGTKMSAATSSGRIKFKTDAVSRYTLQCSGGDSGLTCQIQQSDMSTFVHQHAL